MLTYLNNDTLGPLIQPQMKCLKRNDQCTTQSRQNKFILLLQSIFKQYMSNTYIFVYISSYVSMPRII